MRDQDDFEMWVTEMPDVLEHFIGKLPPDVAGGLDGSPASLSALERWILDTYADTDEVMRDPVVEKFDGAARYVGEVFRTHHGGAWQISFESEKDINYGIPVIDGYPGQETPVEPASPRVGLRRPAHRKISKHCLFKPGGACSAQTPLVPTDIDLRGTRERLLGNEPGSLSWLHDDLAKNLGSSPSPYHGLIMIFATLVDAYAAGLDTEAAPLLAATCAQLPQSAARCDSLPPGERAMFYENAALIAWFADGKDDLAAVIAALDSHEQFLRSAYMERGRRVDVMTLDSYMRFAVQAGQNDRASQFFARAAPQDAEKISAGQIGATERGLAYALALGDSRALPAIERLLQRRMKTWLTSGMRRAAVCWLKVSSKEAALSPPQVVRRALNYLSRRPS